MTIILITLTLGMLFFQFLVSLEAFRKFIKQFNRELNITWFHLPKQEKPWMHAAPSTMTLSSKAREKAWRQLIS